MVSRYVCLAITMMFFRIDAVKKFKTLHSFFYSYEISSTTAFTSSILARHKSNLRSIPAMTRSSDCSSTFCKVNAYREVVAPGPVNSMKKAGLAESAPWLQKEERAFDSCCTPTSQ
jgi:hypothetical protein